jgi:hypothetical protein
MKNTGHKIVYGAIGASGAIASAGLPCAAGACSACFGCAGIGISLFVAALWKKSRKTDKGDNNAVA